MILAEKRVKFGTNKDMYTKGYKKMNATNKKVEVLHEEIKAEKPKADVKQAETKELQGIVAEVKQYSN